MTAQHHDELWVEFADICHQRKILQGGRTDWAWAHHAWRVLDFEQKQAAIEDVQERDAEDYTVARSLPQNYIRGRFWERPRRAPRISKAEEWLRDA